MVLLSTKIQVLNIQPEARFIFDFFAAFLRLIKRVESDWPIAFYSWTSSCASLLGTRMDITFQIVGKFDPVAVYAAVVATFVAAWNIFIWFQTGPKLKLRIWTGMAVVPPLHGTEEDDLYISFKAANIGTSPTTITHLTLVGYSSWFGYLRNRADRSAIVNSGLPFSHPLPHVLKIGETYDALVCQTAEIEEWTRTHKLFGGVVHSGLERSIRVRIQPIAKKIAKP
jgi:hypothetical protein